MPLQPTTLRDFFLGRRAARPGAARRPRRVILSCDPLEGRVTPAHFGAAHQAASVLASHFNHGSSGGSSTLNSALTAAQQQLRTDVLAIQRGSGTTVGQLATLQYYLQQVQNDGLSLINGRSSLSSFEESMVLAFAGGTTLPDYNAFVALYTSTPSSLTTQQSTDLTNAYNALVSAVQSSGISQANINTIQTDLANIQTATGSSTLPSFSYFSLVAGGHGGFGGGGCH